MRSKGLEVSTFKFVVGYVEVPSEPRLGSAWRFLTRCFRRWEVKEDLEKGDDLSILLWLLRSPCLLFSAEGKEIGQRFLVLGWNYLGMWRIGQRRALPTAQPHSLGDMASSV